MPNPVFLYSAQIVAILSILLLAAGYLKTDPRASSAQVFALIALLLARKDLISNNIKAFNFPKTYFVKVHLWIFSLPLSYSCASAPGCVHKTTHGASRFKLVI